MPSTEPTDRSTCRATTTIVSPSARSAKITVLTSTNWMFEADRKRCWRPAVTAMNSASTTTMPDSLIRKTRSASPRELASAGCLAAARGGAPRPS